MASRKYAPYCAAELSLVHLKNCLVNLPSPLVSLLVDVNTSVQNVVVELNYRSSGSNGVPTALPLSVFVGWTGMPSKRRPALAVGRDTSLGFRSSIREQDIHSLEIDATLARVLDLCDGHKVTVTVHVDPPLAQTVNIEPLTPEDWELIKLHANFLELNLQSQVRALPNPGYKQTGDSPVAPHPLTLHLSPTSAANIRVVSIEPELPAHASFAKLSPNAEVIVAPKSRAKSSQASGDHRSVASTSKSKRSSTSTIRRRRAKEELCPVLFFRAIDRTACDAWFEDESVCRDLCVWIDRDLLLTDSFRGVDHVVVDLIRPAGLRKPQPEIGSTPVAIVASSRVVAYVKPWDEPPNDQTAALSSPLCTALGCSGIVGGIVKIQATTQQLSLSQVAKIKVFPFDVGANASAAIRLGGETKVEKEESAKNFRQLYSGPKGEAGLLQGPITDGMVVGLCKGLEAPQGWEGAVIKFERRVDAPSNEKIHDFTSWITSLDPTVSIDMQPPQLRPSWTVSSEEFELRLTDNCSLVGIDPLLRSLQSHLSLLSSVLLTGNMGSGKSCVAVHVAKRLREQALFCTLHLSCRKLTSEKVSISTVKEKLNRIFLSASWGARLGGQALVVLDDLDRLCPVETELQIGNDNGRSRQISEIIRSVAGQFCARETGVVLLATAQRRNSVNNVIVSGHVVREIVELKAPDKVSRRMVLESQVKQGAALVQRSTSPVSSHHSRPPTADGSAAADDGADWMHGSEPLSSRNESLGFALEADLDFLDIAGLTDGYMPGDLQILVSRAKNEAIMRSIRCSPSHAGCSAISLGRADFDMALKGFTPATLRNVPLQSSTTTFESIGGLHQTRKMLLETLEYPTKYAPIFAQCPLRLRSGLLLYGYPGCGKTLLASAVAGQCGLNFISVKGPEILNKYIGASEKSVRNLFDRAQAAKPCVLFFDEFDAIAPKRGHDSTGVTDRVVNQLLTQMDGAEGLSGVYVLAATSRPDLIDPALLRPGRLDKSLLCDMPSMEDRLDILKSLFRKVRLSAELTESAHLWKAVASRTEGCTGADLQALVSNAQLEAIHDELDAPQSTYRRGTGQRDLDTRHSSTSFIQFRYGSDPAAGDGSISQRTSSAALAENAAITSKLQQAWLVRKRARQTLRGPGVAALDRGQAGQHSEVVIGWPHLEKALENTRASISVTERTLLQRIYHEFVEGRSGQMKDGQGSMEIGGRSSLM